MIAGAGLTVTVGVAVNQILNDGKFSWSWLYVSLGISVLALLYTEASATSETSHQLGAAMQRIQSAENALESAVRAQNASSTPDDDASRDSQPARRLNDPQRPPEGNSQTAPDAGGDAPPATAGIGLAELWAVTHSRMDLFYSIATSEARSAFRNAQMAMLFGVLLSTVSIVGALSSQTTAGAIAASAAGIASAALAGFVSRNFLKMRQLSSDRMRAYQDQPLEFVNFLAAERIIRDSQLSSEQRAQALHGLVQSMVTRSASPNR
ncbi:hypothetical protein ABT040_19365 [Streptomyces sp. NPDC002688]|uniref:hypothetical protein n=1 Tax=Streptomyces sp. NPDC002688 TaxID=3154423 RepID=UPI0033300ACF